MMDKLYDVEIGVSPDDAETRVGDRWKWCAANWRLSLAISVASTYTMVIGGLSGYLSPALPNLDEHPNPFRLTADQISWAVSLNAVGSTVGGLVSGTACDLLGRKVAMMSSSLFVIVGFTVLAAATDFRYIYSSMFILSFFAVINMTAATVYVSEVSPAKFRGTCMSLTTLAYSTGLVLAYTMGVPLAWNWLAIFFAALMALPNAILVFLPETPRWFLLKGNREAAVHGVVWFHGMCRREEIASIEQSLCAAPVCPCSKNDDHRRVNSSWRDLLTNYRNRKFLVIVSILFVFQGFSGNTVLQMYTVSIFQAAELSDISPNVQTIIVGLFAIAGSAICPMLVELVGRRLLVITSLITVTVSMAACGTYFLVLDIGPDYVQRCITWLPVVALSASNFGFMLGLFPIGYILGCETMPTNVRGSAQTVFNVVQGLATFTSLKSFVHLQRAIGNFGVFFVYSGICAAGTMFVVCFVAEREFPSTMG